MKLRVNQIEQIDIKYQNRNFERNKGFQGLV